MEKPSILIWTVLAVTLFFTFQSYAENGDGAYQEDALGTIGNPLRQELDADPALVESMDRFEDQGGGHLTEGGEIVLFAADTAIHGV